MKYFSSCILFLLLLFTAHYSNSQCPYPFDFETNRKFKGKVHKIIFTTEDFSESGEKLSQTSGIHEFDIKGHQIKSEETLKNLRWEKTISSFDKNGNEIYTKCFSDKENYEMYKYKYDQNNNLILREFYQAKGTKLLEKSVYKYDENCLRLEIQDFWCRDSIELISRDVFTFNDKRQKVSRENQEMWGETWQSSKFSFAYDESGNLIKCTTESVNSPGEFSITYYEYDNVGNLLRETEKNSEGAMNIVEEFSLEYFDTAKKKIKRSTSKNKKNYYTVYDDKGNWIERRSGDFLEKRTIGYY